MKQATRKESAFVRDYRRAYMKLLTAATSVPKTIDEYFFGTVDDSTDESEEIRPYFYGSISFGLAILLFCYVIVGG